MTDHQTSLPPGRLYSACDPGDFPFQTTAELADIGIAVGQERALDALRFGLGMGRSGFNLFALGPPGAGKATVVREVVAREAEHRPVPDDWCYVHNFAEPSKPKTLRLPPGLGRRFAEDVARTLEELVGAIPAAFEGEEYRARAEEIEEEAKERESHAIEELRREAARQHIALIETPTGFAFAPIDPKDEVLSPDRFHQLPERQQQEIQEHVAQLHQQLTKLMRQFPAWRREAKHKLKALNREIAGFAIGHPMAELRADYAAVEPVAAHLDLMRRELIDHADDFFSKAEGSGGMAAALLGQGQRVNPWQRYAVNLLVDHDGESSAPIVCENLPTQANLIGRVEYQALMGALVTDFTMIKAGALHRANGGYLILDARKLLMQPYAWDSLKRTLETGEVRIEPLERTLGFLSTATLEPEPIPLDIKVILTGDRALYYWLSLYDPEFRELFKVAADFEETMDRDADGHALYARLIGSLARRNGLKPLDRDAVIRVVEWSARRVEDSEKLSTHWRGLDDLLKEADYWAGQQGRALIVREDVQTAIDQQIRRSDRIRERIYEAIRRKTIFIDTEGGVVGQINGLSVISLNGFAFGQPARITATTRLGAGKVVDIERETALGGALHSKGVMILSSFLAARYAPGQPLALAASLVFEQSYGLVDGDSASLAELCALLSALAELPIQQRFAVTGSVNQQGRVQPIGGVNEKVEGFFDICRESGLSGQQGVIIPAANIKRLMLRRDVVAAVAAGRFQVHAVSSVDQALALLMGMEAGARDAAGQFPADSVNGRVERRLLEWADIRRRLAQSEPSEKSEGRDGHG
ncbi:lon-related putative ATP-dependent protease [Methylomagnum ishizawai]|uniref:endopeptidase La n=1 Tax=Methylomagnum ishizawai TaxID=1760988 RepID=A0A1Y6D5A9_9GAMM|nr:AAA family ATPase [Methylomagnum ishizawai]SMF95722.1 lon-related putative ATP-dependent protease [Methylomagnum ishizawai]